MANNRNNSPTHDLLLVEERPNRDGEVKTVFHPVAPLWPLRDGEGFRLRLPFALERGDELIIKPRKERR